jgi:adiponectin receptor
MALMATTYIAGALIYGCRFPERVMPGKFNFFVSITHKKKMEKISY